MATVFISIGSNLGSRLANCLAAVRLMRERNMEVAKLSPWFLSEPLGLPQPWFINGVAWIHTFLSPSTLLSRLQEIEKILGRREKGTGGPRTLDLDIILYGDLVMDSGWLALPHPRFRKRRYVLEPLAFIAPWARDPITGLTVLKLLEACPDTSKLIPLKTGEQPLEPLQLPHPTLPERLPQAFWCHL